jgi:hypothetical protein
LLIHSPKRSCDSPPPEDHGLHRCGLVGLGRFRMRGFRSQAATAAQNCWFKPRVASSAVGRCASALLRRVHFRTARSARGIPASPARITLAQRSIKRSHGQADSSASHEVSVPFSACSPRCAVRGCRPPDDPASALDGPSWLASEPFAPIKPRPVCPCGFSQAIHIGRVRMLPVGVARRGSCTTAFLPAMFRYPPSHELCAAPPEIGIPATLLGFSLRSFVPALEVSERFRSSFPTCRPVGFHLDLFLSRDRPSDISFRGRYRSCLGSAFHPRMHEQRAITEVHLGFWVSTPGTVRFPPSSAFRRGDPALGFASSRSSDTTMSAPMRPRNVAWAISLRSIAPKWRFRLQSALGFAGNRFGNASANVWSPACQSLQSPTLQRFDEADA